MTGTLTSIRNGETRVVRQVNSRRLPVRQAVVSADHDADGTLVQEFLGGHGELSEWAPVVSKIAGGSFMEDNEQKFQSLW